MSKTIPILMYRSLEPERFKDKSALSPELFEKQMRFLSRSFFNVVSLKESIEAGSRENLFGSKTVITFDDGYLDHYTQALPILKKYELPATFFISPEKVGHKGFMNVSMVREIHETPGYEIGSHGLYHDSLGDINYDRVHKSIFESKKSLERMLRGTISGFSYPSGSFDEVAVKLVKKAGYERACAASHVHERGLERNPYTLRRIKISGSSRSNFSFVFRLSGFYNLFRNP